MKLTKLFDMQKALDDRIIKEKNLGDMDRLPYLILALQVELGECANEWRGFKYWSKDMEPRTKVPNTCGNCDGDGMVQLPYEPSPTKCEDCGGRGFKGHRNKLLEEYVDCLHFILSIGNELIHRGGLKVKSVYQTHIDIIGQFNLLLYAMGQLWDYGEIEEGYGGYIYSFIELGAMLGFTWEQIEQAYMDKNAVNHARQANGY